MKALTVFSSSKSQIIFFRIYLSVKLLLRSNIRIPHSMFPFATLLFGLFPSVLEISKQLSFIFSPWLISHIIKKISLYPLIFLYLVFYRSLMSNFCIICFSYRHRFLSFIPHTLKYFNIPETLRTDLALSIFVLFYSFS